MSVEEQTDPEDRRAAAPAKDCVYQVLHNEILHLELEPGTAVSENNLAAELNVSRTPVRDALARLEDEGCVEVFPQRGTRVTFISQERIRQTLFFRISLEQQVLSELCEKGLREEDISLLEESLSRQRRFYDSQSHVELLDEDLRMHQMLFEFSGHGAAWNAHRQTDCDLVRVLFLQIKTFSFPASMPAVYSWENSLTEHRMMLQLLKDRNRESVCILNSRHLGEISWSSDNLMRIYPGYFSER
jgi:DNA-binding GntR family transcriptional regulator